MSEQEFRAAAERALPHLMAGSTYFVDHNDGSVHCATVWLNKREIWIHEHWDREHPNWRREYEFACSPSQAYRTLHIPRVGAQEELEK